MTGAQDRSRCPRCGQPNACGMDAPEGCWCWKEVSARLAPDPEITSCYCRRCLEAMLEAQKQ